jgi:hypothetical protein
VGNINEPFPIDTCDISAVVETTPGIWTQLLEMFHSNDEESLT